MPHPLKPLLLITLAAFGVTACTARRPQLPGPNAAKPAETQSPAPKATPTPQGSPYSRSCPAGQTFRCSPVTQGMAPDPDNPAPTVCACTPESCPAGTSLVASASTEMWPNGTYKGSYGCSDQLPP